MRYPRLWWQLFAAYVVILLLVAIAIGIFATRTHEAFHYGQIREQLHDRAEFIAGELGPSLAEDQLADVRNVVAHLGKGLKTRFTIVRPDGVVVADNGDRPLAEIENHAKRPEIAAALAGETGDDIHFSPTVKQKMLYVAVPLKREGHIIGAARAAVPVIGIEDVVRPAKYEVIGWVLLIALAAALASFLVARRVARPLEQMRDGAERFARGELSYKLREDGSAETAGLAHALNLMAGQMQERIDTIVQQTSRQDAVLESMIEGVLAIDAQSRIISLNAAGARLLGCPRQSAMGRPAAQVIVHPELRQFVQQALASNEPIEHDVELHTGSDRIIQLRGTALGRGDKASGAVIVMNDITNVRRLENLRRDFVANVSHELKTPITSIKGFVETLLDGALDQRADAERFLNIVAKQADRLGAIVDDLLSLAKIEQSEEAASLDLHPAGIRTVLEEALHNVEKQASQRSVPLRLDMPAEISADINPPLLEQAVTNLLDNAIKYSGTNQEVVLSAAATDNGVVIAVRDQGCGIEAEHIPRLFERFYRVDKARSRAQGGTGLGLAIVKHIVSAHRGRIDVQSKPGEGSTFSILLPRL